MSRRIDELPSFSSALEKLEPEIAALRGKLAAVNDLMEKTYAVLSGGGPIEFVTSKLNELERRRIHLAESVRAKTTEREEQLSRESRYYQSKQEIRALVDRLQRARDEDLFALRARVASQLKSLIETLTVASLGERPRIASRVEQLRRLAGHEADEVIAHIEERAAEPDQAHRYFAVGFRDGKVRIVFPTDDDPLRYEQQVIANELWGVDLLWAVAQA